MEGPVCPKNGRVPATLLLHVDCRMSPSDRVATVRPMTAFDSKVLGRIQEINDEQHSVAQRLESMNRDAAAEARQLLPSPAGIEGARAEARSAEQILKTSYKTRDAVAKKESLFPEQQKEISQAQSDRSRGTVWPDQSTKAYKDEVEKVTTPHVGKQLSVKQRRSFVDRVLRAFSVCFWMEGCTPPRVQGFVAHIEAKPDASPKTLQPFPLSAFDRLRFECHEDCDAEDSKAEWIPAGQAGCWGSPSFVIDQDPKGLLGLPVRIAT